MSTSDDRDLGMHDRPKGLFCVGIDAYPALYAWAEGYPGFQGMKLEPFSPVGPLTHLGGGQHGRETEFGGGSTINLPDGGMRRWRGVP